MQRLQLAIQKSGRLQEGSLELLKACGIHIPEGKDTLKASARNFPLDVLYLRNADIPPFIHDQVVHAAILGANTVEESGLSLDLELPLGFAACRLSIAVPKNFQWSGINALQGKRIATSYPHTLSKFLEKHQIQADIHVITGSVEIAPAIGLADVICDLVSSGNTLFVNGLEEKEILLESEATLVKNQHLPAEISGILDTLSFRIKSVLAARQFRYLLMNAPNEQVDTIIQILPGMKSPTVMPLAAAGWSSIHTVISEQGFWDIIDALKSAGAQGILVTPIDKMIL
jgi:ATP phosphoribosyltransferase